MGRPKAVKEEAVETENQNAQNEQANENEQEKTTLPTEKPAEKPVRKKMEIDRTELVEVMNNTKGTFIYKSKKTGQVWRFVGYGATDWMEVGEILTIRSAHSAVLNEPQLIILDDNVVEYLGLSEMYKNILDEDGVNHFFNLPAQKMEEFLEKAPDGMKMLLTQKATEMVQSGELDSVSKRKLFERLFKIELFE